MLPIADVANGSTKSAVFVSAPVLSASPSRTALIENVYLPDALGVNVTLAPVVSFA